MGYSDLQRGEQWSQQPTEHQQYQIELWRREVYYMVNTVMQARQTMQHQAWQREQGQQNETQPPNEALQHQARQFFRTQDRRLNDNGFHIGQPFPQ